MFFVRKCDARSVTTWASQPKHHQHIVNILIAYLERVRLDSVAFKSKGLIKALCGKVGGSHQRDLLDAVDFAGAADNLFHQGTGDALAARFRPHVDTPDVAFMALFVVGVAVKTSRGR